MQLGLLNLSGEDYCVNERASQHQIVSSDYCKSCPEEAKEPHKAKKLFQSTTT